MAPEPKLDTRICDDVGPAQIVDAPASGEAGLWARVGDRLIVGQGPDGSFPDSGGWTFSSVGLCGESPVPLDAAWLMPPTEFGLFSCGPDGRIGKVDPTGAASTVWFAEGLSCGVPVSPQAVVAVDVATAELVWADLSGVRRVLAEEVGGVVDPDRVPLDFTRVQAVGSFVGVIGDDRQLHVVDGEAGEVVAAFPDVEKFVLATDASFVVVDPISSDVVLQPLPIGASVALPGVALVLPTARPDSVLVERGMGRDRELFRVATGEYLPLPEPASAFFVGDRWVALETNDDVAVWDPETGETRVLIEGRPGVRLFGDEGLWAADDSPVDLLTPLRWVWARYDGSETVELPEPMARSKLHPLSDGGVVFLETSAGDGPGTLYWQRGGDEPLVVDDSVVFGGSSSPTLESGGDGQTFVYRVSDGARSGLWRAAMPR